jgi:diguanylate cyclase (GGDEF)-like protein
VCVLVVDDCVGAHQPLKAILQSHGYPEVLTAASAQEAFDVLDVAGKRGTDAPPAVEVVLLDVTMPGVDGIEACRRIKAAPHLRRVPVLMLTGTTDQATLQRAFDAGASDFIAKPCDPAELLARLRSALNLKRELDRCEEQNRELKRVTEQLRQLNEELSRLAVLDELTGIANRRFFNMVLEQEWGRSMRAVLPLSLILIDVDHFKNYNDHYGHQKGDECLCRLSNQFKALTKRPGDQVARYGGEEFVIILSHTETHGACAVAERLRRAVEEMQLEHPCSPVGDHVTISLGVATAIPARHTPSRVLVAAADEALYEAKRNGRNQVRVFEGLPGHAVVRHHGPHGAAAAED